MAFANGGGYDVALAGVDGRVVADIEVDIALHDDPELIEVRMPVVIAGRSGRVAYQTRVVAAIGEQSMVPGTFALFGYYLACLDVQGFCAYLDHLLPRLFKFDLH
jgi:hypothetical protein